MKQFVLLICLILSLILYQFIPVDYNWIFCTLCAVISLIASIIIIRDDVKNINILNFNLIFLFSVFCCSFAFPVFLIEFKSIIGPQLIYEIGTLKYVNKATVICLLAVTSYCFAYYSFRRHNNSNLIDLSTKAEQFYKGAKQIFIFVLVTKAISLYIFRQENPDSINNSSTPYLDMIFSIMVPVYFVSAAKFMRSDNLKKSLKRVLFSNKLVFIIIAFIIVSNLIIGDRGPIIVLTMSLFAVLSLFLTRIKFKHFLLSSLLGIVLMFGLRVTRVGDTSLRDTDLYTVVSVAGDAIMESASPWDMLSDLVGISYELNEGVIMTEQHGYNYPMPNLIRYVCSPIPFLSTYLIKTVYNLNIEDVGAGTAIGKYTRTNAGNHAVVDLYMPFGCLGVLVGFLFFGFFMAKITNGFNKNLFCSFFYVYAVSMALYTPRSSFLTFFKSIFLELLLYYLISKISDLRCVGKKN